MHAKKHILLIATGALALAGLQSNANAQIIIEGPIDTVPGTAYSPSFTSEEKVVSGTGYGYQFNDTSSAKPIVRTWYFGDGTTSNAVNPFHMYADDGVYEVCLTSTVLQNGFLSSGSTCKDVKSYRLGYTLDHFLGGYADELGTPSGLDDSYWDPFLDSAVFAFTAAHKDEFLSMMDEDASPGRIMAWLVETISADYKPFIYFYVGADLCEAFGFPVCNVGPVEYFYFDLWDIVGHIDDMLGMQLGTIYGATPNDDDTDDYITTYYSQALGAGVGPTVGVGIAWVPWPSESPWNGNPHPADFDFNKLGGATPFDWFDNAVTQTVGCGLFFDEDGGFAAETSCGAGVSSQMVRVDLKATHMLSSIGTGLQCAVDALTASGEAHGSLTDNLVALVKAFRLDPLGPEPFKIECASTGETVLDGTPRDVSWGPPILILKWLDENGVAVDITYYGKNAAGEQTIEGTLTFFGNSNLEFNFTLTYDFNSGGSLWVGRGKLSMQVSSNIALSSGAATLSGTMYWGDRAFAWASIGLNSGGLSAGFNVSVTGASFSLGGFTVSINASGDVSLAAGSSGVSASFNGTASATATVTVGSWSSAFSKSISTGDRSFNWEGEANIPVPYPVVQYSSYNQSYPCGTNWCRKCKWGRCVWYPCGTRWCTQTITYPSGVGYSTTNVCLDFFDPPYCD